MPTMPFQRRDPWWDMEGVAARATRRRKMVVSATAFATSITASGLTLAAWMIQLGLARAIGFNAPPILG
jgi:hypothetical protein